MGSLKSSTELWQVTQSRYTLPTFNQWGFNLEMAKGHCDLSKGDKWLPVTEFCHPQAPETPPPPPLLPPGVHDCRPIVGNKPYLPPPKVAAEVYTLMVMKTIHGGEVVGDSVCLRGRLEENPDQPRLLFSFQKLG